MPSVIAVVTRLGDVRLPELVECDLVVHPETRSPGASYRLWSLILFQGKDTQGHFFARCSSDGTGCRECFGCNPLYHPSRTVCRCSEGGDRPSRRVWFEFDFENVRIIPTEAQALTVPPETPVYVLLYAWCART